MRAELNSLQPVLCDVGRDLLVWNLLILPQHLHRERRKEVLIAVSHDQQRMPQRSVRIRIDVDEPV